MGKKYRLTTEQKNDIAHNLIDIVDNDAVPSRATVEFVENWIRTGSDEKYKAYYDVWELVLDSYFPKTRPVLIRSVDRKPKLYYGKKHGKRHIVSFTESAMSAAKFGNWSGYWIICDTKDCDLDFEKQRNVTDFTNSFFPLFEVLKKAKDNGGWGFSNRLIEQGEKEREYIMAINFSFMHLLKYVQI